MIDRAHDLPITKQAKALNISRGSVYYLPRPVPAADLAITCFVFSITKKRGLWCHPGQRQNPKILIKSLRTA